MPHVKKLEPQTSDSSATRQCLQTLGQEKLIGIVRTDSAESAIWTASRLIEAGLRIIEIPFTVPDTPRVIETLGEQYPSSIIGAGTVLEAKDAMLALGAGAQFLVAPVLVEPLIQLGLEQDIPVLPGCMTPTEIYKAWMLGAPAIKFFPAQAAGGAEFVQSIKGPLPQIPIVPTGGIQLEHVAGYLKAGALAVGVGAPLIPKQLVANRDATALQALAKQYLQAREGFGDADPVGERSEPYGDSGSKKGAAPNQKGLNLKSGTPS